MLQAAAACSRMQQGRRVRALQELRCFMLKWLHVFSQSPEPRGPREEPRGRESRDFQGLLDAETNPLLKAEFEALSLLLSYFALSGHRGGIQEM